MPIGAVAATSALMLPVHSLADMVSQSATFQARAGKSAAELLASRIVLTELEAGKEENAEELQKMRPFVILAHDRNEWGQFGQGTRNYLQQRGGVLLVITDNACYTEPADHLSDSETDFGNFAGGLIEDVVEVLGQSDNWPFNRVDMVSPPYRPEYDERPSDDFWMVNFVFSYGSLE